MIKRLLIAMLLCGSLAVQAKDIKRPDTYNYNRGVEEANNGNFEDAMSYLDKELKDYPNNGYAYLWKGAILAQQENYGAALSAANTALKKIPGKDKEYVASCYQLRAKVNLHLEDTTAAIKDYTQAIAVNPEDSENYEYRAQVYFNQKNYDLADADYDKIIALDEGNTLGYMGKGRNLNTREKYDEALKVFNYVIKLASDYSQAYTFRSNSYMGLKQWDKALDDVITALNIDHEREAFQNLQVLADSAYEQTVAKVKVQKLREPNNEYWDYCMGAVHETHKVYPRAIESYKAAYAKGNNDIIAYRIADCYESMGDLEHALEYTDIAIQLDSTDASYKTNKGHLLSAMHRYDEAIAIYDEMIAENPDYTGGYYLRGRLKGYKGDTEGEIEDYSIVISMASDVAYPYVSRGRAYLTLGQEDKARADFLKAVELDEQNEPEDRMSYYAYCYLGEKDKAIEALNATLKTEDKENTYNAACLYSLMGDQDMALDYLEKSLKLGQNSFYHMERDTDLDNIRENPRYKALIDEYKTRMESQLETKKATDDGDYVERVVEVPFTREGGVTSVKCTINDLPLHFIFDTGASDVTISSVEASFMLKNGYLKRSDIGGTQYYQDATGSISAGTVITLRKITIGGLTLENVKASVVNTQTAPLLLGQSVLSRLGKIEIDNSRRVLKITHKEKK